MTYDWADLAFAKNPFKGSSMTFIMAPRAISEERIKQLIKSYLPKGDVVLGIAKEQYIDGFSNQPQFKTLEEKTVTSLVQKVNGRSPHQLHILRYFQREADYIIEKSHFGLVVGVRGSWQRAFQHRPTFYALHKSHTPYELVSPFANIEEMQAEADEFANRSFELPEYVDDAEAFEVVRELAAWSYDYTGQVGALVAEKDGSRYRVIGGSFNKVVPYQTYALHYGTASETNLAPVNDLNHHDTVHAETGLLADAHIEGENMTGKTLFVNVLPCPACARLIVESGIVEVVYMHDHSAGYAARLFEVAGIAVRRVTK